MVVDAIGIVVPAVLLRLSRVDTRSFEDIRVDAEVSCWLEYDGCGMLRAWFTGFLPVVPLVLSVTVRPRLLLVVDGNDVLPPPLPKESEIVLRSLG